MKPEIHRILIPVDFSPPSDRALGYAKALSTEFGAPLYLLHVIEDRLMTGPWPAEVYLGELPRLREDLVKEAELRMASCLESLVAGGIQATGEVRRARRLPCSPPETGSTAREKRSMRAPAVKARFVRGEP